MIWLPILITGLISALALIGGHYFPWRLLIGRKLPRIPSYIYGVLSIALPASGYMLLSGQWCSALALWSSIAAGGMAVIGCYWLDGKLEEFNRRREEVERMELELRQKQERDDQGPAQP
jgi:hypothetical protein